MKKSVLKDLIQQYIFQIGFTQTVKKAYAETKRRGFSSAIQIQ